MVDAGMNLHGTRSVQKVIEVCRGTPSQVALVVDSLRDATVPLCLDTNGNHVVQRLLQHLAPADNAFVFEVRCRAVHVGVQFLCMMFLSILSQWYKPLGVSLLALAMPS